MSTPTTPPSSGDQSKKPYSVKGTPTVLFPPESWKGQAIDLMPTEEAEARLADFFKVYGLADPRDRRVFAVGETAASLDDRLKRYLTAAKKGRSGKIYDHLREIARDGFEPSIVRLPVETEADGFALFEPGQLKNEQPPGSGPAPSLEWTVGWVRPLGRVSDAVIAAMRGVSVSTVARVRRSMGILSNQARLRAARQ